jgi:hypothetical protein
VDHGDADSDARAEVIAGAIGQPTTDRPVERDGAAKAAALIAELV